MNRGHVPVPLLDRYAAGGARVGADVLWALEAHLEACAACRGRLAEAVARHSPDTVALLERVRGGLDEAVARSARMPARRPLRARLPGRALWWAPPALLPRIVMTVLVVAVALGLDLADGLDGGRFPSLVLLLAPVVPLLGVAAAWSGGLDPAHELTCASPRAGLAMVLRRTLAVLMVVIPVLAAGGLLVGASPVRWLLPCLAFTAGALALGELVGLHRAAIGLAVAWVAVAVAPSLITARTPPLLAPASLPGWAALTMVVVVALLLRGDRYTQLPSGR